MTDLSPAMPPACAFAAEPPQEVDGIMLGSLGLALGAILLRLWLGG